MIALGCDHGGYELMQEVKAYLDKQGLEYQDFGCYSNEAVDYPVYARKVGHAIQNGTCDKGILICGTGISFCLPESAFLSRQTKWKESVQHSAPTASAQRQPACTTMPTYWRWEDAL